MSLMKNPQAGVVTTRSLPLHDFFTWKGLSLKMGGCNEKNIPRLCIKELIDNALDSSGKTPEITIKDEGHGTFTVSDKGYGMSRGVIINLVNYNISTSSKFHYIRETRGVLGNALHCVFAAPYVLARNKNIEWKEPWIKIRSKGVEYSIGFKIDWQKQKIKSQFKERKVIKNKGTDISITFPKDVSTGDWLYKLLREFSVFNPNARIIYSIQGKENLLSDGKGNIKLLGQSNIYYYTPREFEDLLVAKARDGMLLSEFVSKFKLLKSDYMHVKEIIEDVWGKNSPTHLKQFSGDRKQILRLQESMRKFSPKPKSKDLGRIGRSNIKRFIKRYYLPDNKGFWYVVKEGVLTYKDYRRIPYVVEVALAYLKWDGGDVYVGFNRSPCIDISSFIANGVQQDWVDSNGKEIPGFSKKEKKRKKRIIAIPHEVLLEYGFDYIMNPDAVLVIHISCPYIRYQNYGKSNLDFSDSIMGSLTKEISLGLIDVFSKYYKYKKGLTRKQLKLTLTEHELAKKLKEIQENIDFKVSTRGWCYMLEGKRVIDKGQFDQAEKAINECRKKSLLPIDFVAEDEGRSFSCVEIPDEDSPSVFLVKQLKKAISAEEYYTPDWWEGEKYYIQMLVEKIDLRTLFQPICEKYHIPIATSKGWSSILQRAELADRFKKAEERGLTPILLYCGDHDPWGMKISGVFMENLKEIQKGTGWDPKNLAIDRFGLNFDFIKKFQLTWIDNLITSSGNEPDRNNPIVKEYIEKYGERKCEANALVVRPREAEELCKGAIEKWLGPNALERFEAKREKVREILKEFKEKNGLNETIEKIIGKS